MADAKDILQILSVLTAAFPNFNERENTPEVFLQLLSDLDADHLKAAVLHCCSEPGRRFAPSVGEIRGAAAELTRLASGVPSSYQAWQEVQQSYGANAGRPWSHPFVKQAVDVFGWWALGHGDNPAADRSRFIEAYEQILHRAEREQTMLPAVRRYVEQHMPLRLEVAEAPRLPAGDMPAPEYVPAPSGIGEQIRAALARMRNRSQR